MVAAARRLLLSYGPFGLFAAGLAMVAAAVLAGDAEVDLVVIIPVVSGSGPMMLSGVALIVLGFLAGFAALATGGTWEEGRPLPENRNDKDRPQARYGGLVMIGPIPIAFGSDRTLTIVMMLAGMVIAAMVIIALVM